MNAKKSTTNNPFFCCLLAGCGTHPNTAHSNRMRSERNLFLTILLNELWNLSVLICEVWASEWERKSDEKKMKFNFLFIFLIFKQKYYFIYICLRDFSSYYWMLCGMLIFASFLTATIKKMYLFFYACSYM
jgi:hypothetical protein